MMIIVWTLATVAFVSLVALLTLVTGPTLASEAAELLFPNWVWFLIFVASTSWILTIRMLRATGNEPRSRGPERL